MSRTKNIPFQIKRGNPQHLGVYQTEKGYNFAVAVENDQPASLLLYKSGSTEVIAEIPLPEDECTGDVRTVLIEGMQAQQCEYNYRIGAEIIGDPYARALSGRTGFGDPAADAKGHHIRGRIYDNPGELVKGPWIPYDTSIIYKLHVRGFTKHKASKVKAKGTFTGLQEKIPYLSNLGITTVELMPAYEFEECPDPAKQKYSSMIYQADVKRVNYWGYADGYYFAPKSAYCAGKDPIAEFRQTVTAFHKAGMEVLMEFYFTPQTSPVFILEVLRFWKLWYGVDGFHLTGTGIPIEIIAEEPLLKQCKILYTGFDINHLYGRQTPKKRVLAEYHQGFMENMRRFLKGDEDQVSGVIWHLKHNPKTHGVVNYVTCQDGFTLADLVTYDHRHNEANGEENRDGTAYNYSWNCGIEGPTRKVSIRELRQKQMRNSILFLMLSQGTPMLYAGDELGNSQSGNNNAYCQDNPIGWVDWTKNKRSEEMSAFVKAVIAFRKEHRIFHAEHELQDTDYRAIGIPEISFHGQCAWVPDVEVSSRQLGVMYCGQYVLNDDKKSDAYFYVAYNMHWEEQGFDLPKLPISLKWNLAIDSSAKEEVGIYPSEKCVPGKSGNHFKVPPRTIIVLIGRQAEKE